MKILYAIIAAICVLLSFALTYIKFMTEHKRDKKLYCFCAAGTLTALVSGFFVYADVGTEAASLFKLFTVYFVLAGAGLCDLYEKRIPNIFFVILLVAFLISEIIILIKDRTVALDYLSAGFISGIIAFALLMVLRVVSKGGLGYGDIKLFTTLSVIMGLYGAFSILFFGQIAALLVVVAGLIAHRLTLKGNIPLAPFFYLGYVVTIITGTF
ncbi:MAG: prepilin peptidase [Lachnospiraceae bacterium]|nr:prepilin peptidase [Lachnospiraceae bacterium]